LNLGLLINYKEGFVFLKCVVVENMLFDFVFAMCLVAFVLLFSSLWYCAVWSVMSHSSRAWSQSGSASLWHSSSHHAAAIRGIRRLLGHYGSELLASHAQKGEEKKKEKSKMFFVTVL
jgi:hypothetical protein